MRRILLYIALVLAAVGCQNRVEPVEQQGEAGQLKFESFKVVADVEEQLAPRPTRTEIIEGDPTVGDGDSPNALKVHILAVTITDISTGKIVESYADHTAMPATIVLKAGRYLVSARTADVNSQLPYNGQVGFDQPQYAATQEIEIISGEITSITVSCRQTTAGVTVDYSDLFKEIYPCVKPGETYRTRIFSSYGGDISFVKGETRTAHFVVPTDGMMFFYQISVDRVTAEGFIETVTGEEVQFDTAVMPVRQACNYNLTIKVLNQ